MYYEDEKLAFGAELTEAEIEEVAGGASFYGTGSLTIKWEVGQKMRTMWEELDGYASVLHNWGINVEEVKNLIRSRAEEKIAANLYYYARRAGSVTMNDKGTFG